MQEQATSGWSDNEQLADRVRHAVVFCEATLRALRDALALLDQQKEERCALTR
jgi:hypothetical protein